MMRQCLTADLMHQAAAPLLLVSLPANDPELARAAIAGGAQGLKVHLNLTHAASGTHLGPLEQEAAGIAGVVALGLPVGVVPGDRPGCLASADLMRLADLGLDYLDMYLTAMPAWVPREAPVGVMAAVGAEDMVCPARLEALTGLPGVDMVEASQVAHEGYGLALSAADLCDYTGLVRAIGHTNKPVVVPTQRAIGVEDVPALARTGIKGLLIGAVVTGREAAGIEAATRAFRQALDALPGMG